MEEETASNITGRWKRIISLPRLYNCSSCAAPTHRCTCSRTHTSVLNYSNNRAEQGCKRRDCLLVRELENVPSSSAFEWGQSIGGLGDLQSSWGSVSTLKEGRCWEDTYWLFCKTGLFMTLWTKLCSQPSGLQIGGTGWGGVEGRGENADNCNWIKINK